MPHVIEIAFMERLYNLYEKIKTVTDDVVSVTHVNAWPDYLALRRALRPQCAAIPESFTGLMKDHFPKLRS